MIGVSYRVSHSPLGSPSAGAWPLFNPAPLGIVMRFSRARREYRACSVRRCVGDAQFPLPVWARHGELRPWSYTAKNAPAMLDLAGIVTPSYWGSKEALAAGGGFDRGG